MNPPDRSDVTYQLTPTGINQHDAVERHVGRKLRTA